MNNAATLEKKAQALLSSGQLQEALSVYINITESNSGNAEGWLMRGVLSAECGSIDDAVESINKALVVDPTYAEAYLALAKIHHQLNNQKQAKELLLRVLELDAEYAEAWAMLGGVHGAAGEYDESKKCSSRSVELWPECLEGWVNFGNVLDITGDHEQAVTCFEKALQIAPGSAEFHFQLGRQHIAIGKTNEAERDMLDALAIDPSIGLAQYELARLLHKKGDWTEAAFRYKEVIRLQPGNAQAWYYLGLLMEKEAKSSEAESCYQKVLAIGDALSGKKLNAHAKLQISGIYIEQGKRQEAAELLQDLITVIPENAAAIHLLSVVGVAATPERCSDDFVTSLFDGFADEFDNLLVDKLNYHIPELILDSVKSGLDLNSDSEQTILDLGCGTGLCGALLKPLSNNLIGIDLSPKMLDVARQKNVYKTLLIGDILEVIRGLDETCDIVVSADVFIYIGALDEIFVECKRVLQNRGIFVFSIETCSDEGNYKLLSSGRYAHNPAYIRGMAQRQGFEEINAVETSIRTESRAPIPGMVFTLRK